MLFVHVMDNTPVTCLEVAKSCNQECSLDREALGLDEILLEVNHITETHERNSVMERW